MKTSTRNVLLGTLVALVLGLAVLFATVTRVNLDPEIEAPWRTATRTRLANLARETNTSVGSLRAGFARARLTPRVGVLIENAQLGEFPELPLAGYGSRNGRPATGVLDELWVKAVAFSVGSRTGIVVTADALIIPHDVADEAVMRITASTGLHRDQLYFAATHSHCSLGGWGEGLVGEAFAGPFHPGVRTWFSGQLATAATNALADLTPASMGTGFFSAPHLVRNRLVGDLGRINPTFSLISVRQEDGDSAVLGSFSAHATVQGSSTMQFSADYPGAWQRAVEHTHGGLALFLAGAVGSHGPRPPAAGSEGARQMGAALASETLRTLKEVALTNVISFGQASVEADLPELQNRLTDSLRLRPWVSRKLLPPLAPRTFLQALRLGDAVWCSTPCDYSGELSLDLEDAACRLGLAATVTSFNGDYLGYVVPAKYYHLNGYEPRTMSFYGPAIPDYFDEILRSLLGAVRSR